MGQKLEKDSLEGLRNRLQKKLESKYPNCYIIATFRDSVIVNSYEEDSNQYYEIDYAIKDEIEIGERRKVNVSYITEKIQKGSFEKSELTGPIFKQAEEQRIVYAAVLVPGEPDYDYEAGEKLLSKEEIERVAHMWMLNYRNIDYMHGLNNVAKPIESFILPMEYEVTISGSKTNLPQGTWILGAKVDNDTAWKDVKEGKLTGFSIMGIQNTVLKDIMDKASKGETANKEFESSLKRVLIKDLGEDWIVPFVSLVDEPCVPKAKMFSIKQKEEINNEGVWNKIVAYFKKTDDIEQMKESMKQFTAISEKAGRSISDSTYQDLKKAIDALMKLIEKADKEREVKEDNKKGEKDMNEQEVKDLVEKAIDDKLKPIHEGLEKLLASKGEKDTEPEIVDKGKEDVPVEKEDDVVKRLEALEEENKSYKQQIEQLKESKKGKSKVEKGQEDGEEEVPQTVLKHYDDLGRDSFGIARKGVNK